MKTKDFRVIQGMLVGDANNSGGSGPSGDVDYPSQVINKPKVNNITLTGNLTSEALGLTSLDIFTEETQTLTDHLQEFKNYVDDMITKRNGEIDLILDQNVKVELINGANNIQITGIGKTINFNQELKVGGNDVATKNQLVGRYVDNSTTSITIGNDLAEQQLFIKYSGDETNITTLNGSQIGINHLFVKDDEDTDIITISSGYGTIELNGIDIKISSAGNSALISFVDGQLAINGKKILTE